MSEYLSEEEQVERLKTWWDKNANAVLIAVVVAVAGVGGWQWYGSYTQDSHYAASQLYESYLQGDAEQREQLADQLAEEYAGSAYHVMTLLDLARRAVDGADLNAAVSHLEQAIEEAGDELLVDLARIRLAKVQQALDLSDAALANLGDVSSAGYRSWALELKGDLHMARGEIELAHSSYQAAQDGLADGDQRPLLQMKLENAAPFGEAYVELQDNLSDALREATQALDAAEQQTEEPAQESAAQEAAQEADE